MSEELTTQTRDRLLINFVRSYTDLTNRDIKTLLEVSHSLPFISNLESSDTYINVLTKEYGSMVVAQYRHPNCDLYGRDIIGEVMDRTDEPAVYRTLECGLSSRGMIGIIDSGRTMVRHTVSPIFNHEHQVIGSLTNEYPNKQDKEADGESVCLRSSIESKSVYLDVQFSKVAGCIDDGFLAFDQNGICTFANAKAEKMYHDIGYSGSIIGKKYGDLQLLECSVSDIIMEHSVIQDEIQLGDYYLDASINAIWEDDVYQGMAVILHDKTKICQLESEISYRTAAINEVHHRVKNNLQTIISLVGLSAQQSKNDQVKEFSKGIISRICSISVAHDLLAHSGTDKINLKTMLMRVLSNSMENDNANQCQITPRVLGDDLEVIESVASTVALVANELLQNSLKYAFRECTEGTIWLTVEKGEEYSWISVGDNGCGYDKKAEKKPGSGLGLRLVENLVRSSLRGEFSVCSNEHGTVTRFSFCNEGKKTVPCKE